LKILRTKPYVIPVFLPNAGCKRRCVFCSQKDITGHEKIPTLDEVKKEIEKFLRHLKNKERPVEIAFYGGTFTALPVDLQKKFLKVAREFIDGKRIIGIRLSTRPDDVPPDELDFLKESGVLTIELGIQSFCDDVLIKSNRGYTSKQAINACREVKARGFKLGVHLMTDLPGSSNYCDLFSAFKTVELDPDMVRIHPTLVIKNSALERMFFEKIYRPQSLEEALDLLSDMYLIFKRYSVTVNRIGLQIPVELRDSIVSGPYHPSLGDLVEIESFYKLTRWFLETFNDGEIIIAKNKLHFLNSYGKRNLKRLEKFTSRIKIEDSKNISFRLKDKIADYSTVLEKYIEELHSKLKVEGRR